MLCCCCCWGIVGAVRGAMCTTLENSVVLGEGEYIERGFGLGGRDLDGLRGLVGAEQEYRVDRLFGMILQSLKISLNNMGECRPFDCPRTEVDELTRCI